MNYFIGLKQVSQKLLCLLLNLQLTCGEIILTLTNQEERILILSFRKDLRTVVKPRSLVSYNYTLSTSSQIHTLSPDIFKRLKGMANMMFFQAQQQIFPTMMTDRSGLLLNRPSHLPSWDFAPSGRNLYPDCIIVPCLEWIFYFDESFVLLSYYSPVFFVFFVLFLLLLLFLDIVVIQMLALSRGKRKRTNRRQHFQQQNALCWFKSYTKLWP